MSKEVIIDPTSGVRPGEQTGFGTAMNPDITSTAMQKKLVADALAKREERTRADLQRLSKFAKDKTRSTNFSKKHKIQNSDLVCIEVFLTYPKPKADDLESNSILGLNARQEGELILYPIVKNLGNNKLYTVPDHLSVLGENPDHGTWMEKAAGSPQYRAAVKEPPKMAYGFDIHWNQYRFDFDKVNRENTVEQYYTFIVPKSALITEYIV